MIDPVYQVFIGTFIGGVLLSFYRIIKEYFQSSKESQKMAILSIFIGLLFFIPFIGVIGLIIGIISYFRKTKKTLSVIGIVINLIFIGLYTAVLIFGV